MTQLEFKEQSRDFSIQECCSFFRVTPPTVYRMLNEGKLKGYTIGRSRRVTHESVECLRQTRIVSLKNPK